MTVRVHLLGTPRIAHHDILSPLDATRPAALLAYLACRTDWVRRDEAALVFRPDAGDAEARIYLRKLVFRARRLPFAHSLEATEERIRWAPPTDVVELRRAVAEGRWEEAAAFDGSPLLDGFRLLGSPGFDAWVEVEREAAGALWRRGVVMHAAELEGAGRMRDAIALRERYLLREPLDEGVVQDLLRATEGSGERERGLVAFDTFAACLEREVGVEPAEVTQALADAVRALPPSTVRTPSPPPASDDVPRPATSFIGRRSEIERLAALLGPGGPRLITLVGLGGVGKTRLAIEGVRRLQDEASQRVVFVPLSSAPAGSRLVDAIGAALAVTSDEGRLIGVLSERPTLLVLDGVETPEATWAMEAADLLAAAPRLRALVTARVPLGLGSERTISVEGLNVPTGDAEASLRGSDAVTLFLRRASGAAPDILDAPDSLRAVADICRSLGGLPLAIELAAAWTRALSVEALREELRDGADMLRTDAPDVPERHRSVRVVIDHAWQGLRPDHRDALARLTVFRGPWSLAAARAVAGADLDTMVALLTSSLVRRVERDRFEMHALVRHAVPSRLDVRTRDAHARHVLAWLTSIGPDLITGDQAAALTAVHASLADVLTAWEHAARRGMVEELAAALMPLDYALHGRSLWEAALRAYREALHHLPESADVAETRVRIQVRLANIERNVGNPEGARTLLRAALTNEAVPEGTRPHTEARLEVAKLDEVASVLDAAASSYRAVLAAAGPGDDDLRGAAHTGLGNVLFHGGEDPQEGMRHYEEGLAVARRSGDVDLLTIALINKGAGHYDVGEHDAARRSWREAASLAARVGNRLREASTLHNLAVLAEHAGDTAGAREAYERSLRIRQDVGDRRGHALVLLNLGRLAQVEGRIDEADAHLEAAVAGFEELDVPGDLALALGTRARVRAELGDLGGASRLNERALRLGRLAMDRSAMLVGLLGTAMIALRRGRIEEARRGATWVAELARGSKEGARASALALLAEAEAVAGPSPVHALTPSRDGETGESALAAEVDRVLRGG
jgi:DNA-binding SARP family transcriptional activator/tetratricopeptide (TPR) repeat protein